MPLEELPQPSFLELGIKLFLVILGIGGSLSFLIGTFLWILRAVRGAPYGKAPWFSIGGALAYLLSNIAYRIFAYNFPPF